MTLSTGTALMAHRGATDRVNDYHIRPHHPHRLLHDVVSILAATSLRGTPAGVAPPHEPNMALHIRRTPAEQPCALFWLESTPRFVMATWHFFWCSATSTSIASSSSRWALMACASLSGLGRLLFFSSGESRSSLAEVALGVVEL
eukprot:CAMPEP_0167775640 /NCGR_PEP_ID=MMETSP0111_2-20121227/2674_1 /TAXON_ID=91324 /ORGANISM="Lotharella globosa, Strain CCCM811" /LENGTH=144 /DNA_ID=CAMNT_0007665583 /DNA_START=207 /DNA_END=642 /DNA_ORIENTATION=-